MHLAQQHWPRCVGSGYYPRSEDCTTDSLTAWADEMSTFIKSLDPNHLVSVGDEGFFCDDPTSWDWTTNCGEGIDHH
jgi:mannan endo-1,4-beta-mannosidase